MGREGEGKGEEGKREKMGGGEEGRDNTMSILLHIFAIIKT